MIINRAKWVGRFIVFVGYSFYLRVYMKSSRLSVLKMKYRYLSQGAIAMLPLSIAVIPWGILAGSMAVGAGLSIAKAMGMSIFIFAGAAQLMSLGLAMAKAPAWVIILSVFFLTSQHFIYALVFRPVISRFKLPTRLALGFLLTDELFAVGNQKNKHNRYFLLGAGFSFYVFWVLSTYVGVLLASSVPNLSDYHLDFSIVAIFVPIVVSLMKNRASVFGVLTACILAFLLTYWQMKSALILAGICGMVVAAVIDTFTEKMKGK